MQLKMRYYGDPILRGVAAKVESFDPNLKETAQAMIDIMREERGIGLAGPQVGLSQRLIIVLQMADPDDTEAEPMVLVNPEVTRRSKDTWELEEGCLSIPGITGRVMRAVEISARFQDMEGKSHTLDAEGMFARVVLHEIDHLDGKLFVDYLSSAQKSLVKPQLKRIAESH